MAIINYLSHPQCEGDVPLLPDEVPYERGPELNPEGRSAELALHSQNGQFVELGFTNTGIKMYSFP